jgi:hypothetical protein
MSLGDVIVEDHVLTNGATLTLLAHGLRPAQR